MTWHERISAAFEGVHPRIVKIGNMHPKHYALLHAALLVKELGLSNYAKISYN
jgi:hypothetical protein